MKCALILLLFSMPAVAQTESYGMKGDTIGESLSDFRARNQATVTYDKHEYPRCSGDVEAGAEPKMPAFSNPKTIVQDNAAYSQAITAYRDRYDSVQMLLDGMVQASGEDRFCRTATSSVAGAGGSVQYWFKSDRLDKITGGFPRDHYFFVKNAVVAKYGEPTESAKHTYETKAGDTLDGEEATWKRPDSIIELDEVSSSDVDVSSIVIANPGTEAARVAAMQKKANSDF